MSDLAEAPLSTALESDTLTAPSGGGVVTADPEAKVETPKVEPAKPSLRDTINEAVKETDKEAKEPAEPDADKAKEEVKAEKPGAEEKPSRERSDDGKFKGAEKPEGEKPEPKTGHIEPPAKFLPDAKEKWVNTPRSVQRDVENMAREYETELTRHREASERYESIRQYDELARQNGRAGIHESLAEIVRLEDMMQQNPVAAINQILLQAGPRKPDGQPVSLFELAQVIVQQGQQGYQKMVTQAPQQQPQNDNREVAQLRAEIAGMREQQVATSVIEPFRAAHPRYDELQGDIALFLQSGKIPASLSAHDRLEAAYDMAVRVNPASHAAAETKADPDPGSRVAEDLSGSKSIKSAPGAVSPDMEPERGGSTRDIIRDQMRRQKVS